MDDSQVTEKPSLALALPKARVGRLNELIEKRALLDRTISMEKEQLRAKIAESIEESVESMGFALDDVFGDVITRLNRKRSFSRGRNKVPLYRDTDNASNVWSGRGRRPRWLADKLAKGEDINSFLNTETGAGESA